MEAYAKVLNYAIPFFLMLIAIEWIVGRYRGLETNRPLDTISSLSSGMTNSIKDVLGLTFVIVSYSWMVDHLAIYTIQQTLWVYIVAFLGLDFAGYWSHRFEHKINLFWNRHIIHHSSEEFNLSCALRQNVSAIFAIFTFLFIPMALLGIPAIVVAVVAPIHLFAQFWYHTKLINRMGILEHIIVTPSHHRVHHAINDIYIDKNFSQIFIVWDKLFGTFQEELDEVPPVYGIKKQANTWNPILINFQHLWLIIKDAWHTHSIWDKMRVWFMPTGWRPADVIDKYPIKIIEDPLTVRKYDTNASNPFVAWSFTQLTIHMLLMLYLFNNVGNLAVEHLMLYGAFMMVSIFSYTSLMDGVKWAWIPEAMKFIFGIWLIYWTGSWFKIDLVIPAGTKIVIAYLMISVTMTIYFITNRQNVETQRVVA